MSQGVTDKIGKADFRDMILLEYDRSEADYRGYLLYDKDGRIQWLFDAICVGSGRYNGQSIGEGEGLVHLDKTMTTNLMNEYFEDGRFLPKINKVISGIKPSVPGTFIPRKIVLTIPLIVNDNWGELDGVALHPSNETAEGRADRATIAKWFVDECLKRFAEKDYENLKLIGFYWHEENGRIWEENGMKIANHIHSYGLNFYWVPWFNAYNNTKWKEYGFDAAWLQPNYLFYEDQYPDKSQLYNAYEKATANGMYLEMELDNLRKLQRQIEYWDVYEEKAFWKTGLSFTTRVVRCSRPERTSRILTGKRSTKGWQKTSPTGRKSSTTTNSDNLEESYTSTMKRLLAIIIAAYSLIGSISAAETSDNVVYKDDHVRFTLISPRSMRLEYSPMGNS